MSTEPRAWVLNLDAEHELEARGRYQPTQHVLAIGDSVRTDLEGANAAGFRCLFVTSGIHAAELGERANPDAASVAKLFKGASKPPFAVTPKLMW